MLATENRERSRVNCACQVDEMNQRDIDETESRTHKYFPNERVRVSEKERKRKKEKE